MEEHQGVYEQILEVNTVSEGAEFISQQLVEEIVVQNDNNQSSSLSCEISNMEIIMSNDCTLQEQCNNILSCSTDAIENQKQIENVILQENSKKDQNIPELNNIEENITSSNIGSKELEEGAEDFILHNDSFEEEKFEVSSSVVVTMASLETDDKEVIVKTSETVTDSNANESNSVLSLNQEIDDSNLVNSRDNVIENSSELDDKNLDEIDEKLENELLNDENDTDNYITNIQLENTESIKTENNSNDNQENENTSCSNITEKTEVKCENQSSNINQEKEISSSNSNLKIESNFHTSTDVSDFSSVPADGENVKILSNSHDVTVLTEYNSVEYNMQEDEVREEKVLEADSNENTGINEAKEQTEEEDKDVLESTEKCVSADKKKEENKSNDVSIYELENEEEEDELDLHLSAQSTESHRKVIQDIFDDWQDENGEEEVNESTSVFKDNQDSVEMELQNLLNDDVQQEQTISSTSTSEQTISSKESDKNADKTAENTFGKSKITASDKVSSPVTRNDTDSKGSNNKSAKAVPNHTLAKDRSVSQSPKNSIQDQSDFKQKFQSPRPGVKVPGLHLTSQIASTAEVNEVLKERLREKQKDFQSPKTADIVFVKKITQRLSSQLSAASSMPPLIPMPSTLPTDHENEKNKSTEEVLTETNKSSSTNDNKELLAILEGDVDPDWSNLKSTSEEGNKVPSPESHSAGSKLDPITERELALKQLLELPNITSKKSSPGVQKKVKKTGKSTSDKPSPSQVESKSTEGGEKNSKVEVINVDSSAEEESPRKGRPPKASKENNNQNSRSNAATTAMEINVEESRSGRKRKLTEKAREHELSVKRQKVIKGKTASEKKPQEFEESSKQKSEVISSTPIKVESEVVVKESNTPKSSQDKVEIKSNKPETRTSQSKTESNKDSEVKSSGLKGKLAAVKKSKLGILKKDAPIGKRKLMVKNMLRQKVGRKAKSQTEEPSNKSSTTEKTTSTPPGNKVKKVSEIDRLLQDEGVVNLLYDVEQPDSRKRLVPITKTQKKVMDVEKAQKEFKLRKKMVKNAVMRLRNANTASDKTSPRSRRNVNSSDQPSPQNEKKVIDATKSGKAPPMPVPTEFIIPAKIRNAAEASRIIRRHSSSSFSSASASPRVSVDMPPESLKFEDNSEPQPTPQPKPKRKLSQDSNDKVEVKKGKKKEAKEVDEKTPVKKEQVKKVTTRSNVTPTGAATSSTKTVSKNKKVPKSRTSLDSSSSDGKSSSKGQDELSACLAEAASALSSISGSSRSSNATNSRKKASTNNSKATDGEKVDVKKLFSNKEINVRYHGHLVQLIMTPSAPVSGIRNAMTTQVMNELREALSILKNDDDCRVVLFTSTGTSFCEGLELSSLLHSNKEERKKLAEEMSLTVKEFIKSLATFNKPIVAGVQGAAIGLGVTMLPLFDLVIASDKATFSTPYGKLGQIAEGTAVLTLSHSVGSAVTNELLLGGRILTASEALRAGLVTRVLWPDRFQGELLPLLKAMSEQSTQSMQATKALLRESLCEKLDARLESESLLLVKHWCSAECQDAIKTYIEENGQ